MDGTKRLLQPRSNNKQIEFYTAWQSYTFWSWFGLLQNKFLLLTLIQLAWFQNNMKRLVDAKGMLVCRLSNNLLKTMCDQHNQVLIESNVLQTADSILRQIRWYSSLHSLTSGLGQRLRSPNMSLATWTQTIPNPYTSPKRKRCWMLSLSVKT